MEFSFDKQQTNSDPSQIANERLRKAIERNRQRQKEREEKEAQTQQAPQPQYTRPSSPQPEPTRTAPPPPPQYEQPELQAQPEPEVAEEPVVEKVTRRTVARGEDTEFVAVRRTPKKAAPALNYHTTSTRKKSKPLDPTIARFLIKATWIFAVFLVLRLLFARGGVTDFYSQHRLLANRQNELSEIKNENMQLVREIERMHTDAGYQKKLVRDNLGFIAADEFLVLFPKD